MAKGGSHLPPSHHNNICLINNTHLIIFGLTTRLLNKFPSPSISGLPLISFTYWLLPHARPPPAIPVFANYSPRHCLQPSITSRILAALSRLSHTLTRTGRNPFTDLPLAEPSFVVLSVSHNFMWEFTIYSLSLWMRWSTTYIHLLATFPLIWKALPPPLLFSFCFSFPSCVA